VEVAFHQLIQHLSPRNPNHSDYSLVQSSVLFNPGVMHVNALTNAQKLFSQMLILRYFQEVNTQANTQQIHTYKPKTFFATIANAQFSIHTANHI